MINAKPAIRLTSLDVFRGIAIAGMILVNKASIGEVYPFLDHAPWNGCTLADLVFPFFLFIVGVAMAFSLSKYTEKADYPNPRVEKQRKWEYFPADDDSSPTTDFPSQNPKSVQNLYWRILRRSAILFALGLLLNGFWNYDFSTIRIMGVLQRISIAYLLASLAVLNLPRKGQWALAALLLLGYWILMSFIPVPGYGAGVLTREGNFAAYIDRLIIGTAHLYKGDNFNSLGDPEGLFSTLPAVVNVLFGYFTGKWLQSQPVQSRTSIGLILSGVGCLISGLAWDWIFPINKKLWASSYVLFTTGLALLVLAACYYLIEVRKIRRWGIPFEAMGLNAIFLFVASVLTIKILFKTKTYTWIYENIFVSLAGALNGSLLFAVVTLLFWGVVAYGMYRQRWFFKV